MLTKKEKNVIVDSLKNDMEKAQGIFLTNVIGLTSNDGVALRKEVRDAEGKLVVTRNTLFKLAAKGTTVEELLKDIKGPHALAFAFADAPRVAKALKVAGKKHEVVDLKAGIFEGKILSFENMQALADLPPRDEMLGTLLATFNAPIAALARVLFAIGETLEKVEVKVEAKEEVKVETKEEET